MKRLAALALALLAGCAPPAPQGREATVLLFASPYSPGHPFSRADQAWMRFVEAESGGAIRVKPVWSGGLISSDESMTELRHGVGDVGLITPIYVKGGAHLLRIQTGFYTGADAIEAQVALYRCMAAAEPQFARELKGLHVLAVQGGVMPGIITRDRPVRSLADLRGLRLRAPTELLEVLRDLGADPVNMPMGDVYPALAKGVIDGVVAPPDTFKSLHFAEVARHFVYIAIPRGAYPARAMGEARWQSLSPDQRALLDRSTAVWEVALAEQNREAVDAGMQMANAAGVVFTRIPAADQARFDQLYLDRAAASVGGLRRYGIDGSTAFRVARASIRPGGAIDCSKG